MYNKTYMDMILLLIVRSNNEQEAVLDTTITMLGMVTIIPHAGSQAEARKPGLQHYMSLDVRNPAFFIREQQRRRPDCASAHSDQNLCYSLSQGQISLNSPFLVGFKLIKPLATPLILTPANSTHIDKIIFLWTLYCRANQE